MLDTLPPSVPTGSARAARTAGKKLEFAREYCSRRAVPIRLFLATRSLSARRGSFGVSEHTKSGTGNPSNGSRFQVLCDVSRLQSSQRANGRCRRNPVVAAPSGEGPFTPYLLDRGGFHTFKAPFTAIPVPLLDTRGDKLPRQLAASTRCRKNVVVRSFVFF
jgi:hypothetical protein